MVACSVVMIAHTYASALMAVVYKERAVSVVTAQLLQVLTKLSENGAARIAFANPTLRKEEKISIFKELLKKEPHPIILNLVQILTHHHRLVFLLEVIRAYLILQTIQEGSIPLKIVTARDLDRQERSLLLQKIEIALTTQVIPTFSVDPGMLGGIRIFIGPYLLDASWASKLDALTRHLEHIPAEG